MSKLLNFQQLNILSQQLVDNWESLMACLGIEMKKGPKAYTSQCFVHGGDKYDALNLYHSGEFNTWKCFTHSCHEEFTKSALGLLRGILSNKNYNWSQPGDKKATFAETIEFASKCLNKDFSDIKIDHEQLERANFIKTAKLLTKSKPTSSLNLTRPTFRGMIELAPQFYLDRGYSHEILDRYDVGLCTNPASKSFNRICVPIYNNKYSKIIGVTSRSIFDKCPLCNTHHNPRHKCPYKHQLYLHTKWHHNKDFRKELCLYNYWFAKESIKQTGVAVLVESPGNVWRLEQSGINTSIGVCGSSLTAEQNKLLNKAGCLSVIVCGDNDKAGQNFNKQVAEMCKNIYKIFTFIPPCGDIGEMTVEQVKEQLLPLYNQCISERIL